MTTRKNKEQIIAGTVIPKQRNGNDKVICVALNTADYQQYVVEYNEQGKELLSLVDQRVQVRGKIRERLNGDLIITVKSFERIEQETEGRHASGRHVD